MTTIVAVLNSFACVGDNVLATLDRMSVGNCEHARFCEGKL